jgi:hypothetical protein
MRRISVLTLAALALLGLVAPDAWAQAPTPTFKINGLIDQVTTYTRNMSSYDLNLGNTDTQWYGRTRGRLDFIGEVGKAKGVIGIEFDAYYGQTGSATSNVQGGFTGSGATGSFGLNTDVRANIEMKWLYTEFEVPMMPVPTLMRLGAQPFGGASSYKLATYANGDYAGAMVSSKVAQNVNVILTYAQLEEGLTYFSGCTVGGSCPSNSTGIPFNQQRGDDYAGIIAVELTPIKGLDIKPMYSFMFADGTTQGSSRVPRGGVNTTTNFSGPGGIATPGIHEYRNTVGVDARWRWGAFSLDPTVLYQFGSRDMVGTAGFPGVTPGKKVTSIIDAWLFDVRAGFQVGPVLIQGLYMFTTGNKGKSTTFDKTYYFQPLDTDTSYLADWGTQITSLGVDYYQILGVIGGSNGGTSIGWDKYGRQQLGVKATYAWTPALSMGGGVSFHMTHREVDTDGTVVAGSGLRPNFAKDGGQGDSMYVGTELHGSLTWRFAPGLALDTGLGYLIAGDALDAFAAGGNAKDIFLATTRVRFTF